MFLISRRRARRRVLTIAYALYPAHRDVFVTIVSSKTTPATVLVVDMTGKLVITKAVSLARGQNRFTINLLNLTPGVYEFKILGKEGSSVSSKLMKMPLY